MKKEKRIQLDPVKLVGFKHLAPSKDRKIEIARAMVGDKAV